MATLKAMPAGLLHSGTAALLSPTQVHQWLSQAPFLLSGHTVLQIHSPLQDMQLHLDASLHLEAVYEQACHML